MSDTGDQKLSPQELLDAGYALGFADALHEVREMVEKWHKADPCYQYGEVVEAIDAMIAKEEGQR